MPHEVRAVVAREAKAPVEVVTIVVPDPGPGEALVQVQACGVCHTDLHYREGGIGGDFPYLLGHEAAGVVDAAGEGVTSVAPGDFVVGVLGIQEQAIAPDKALTKVDTNMAPLETFLGGLGMPGLTAYFGLTEVGDLKEGDTVVVSGAAGAVGSVAGQIAKAKGAANVVGIAGGPEKCAWLVDELGFDAAIDYKSEKVGRRLHELCPDGINVYFDNVGGEILDAALANLAWGARVVICGAISQYNADGDMRGPKNYMMLLVKRSRMQGFLVFDYVKQYGDALREMAGWRADGSLKTREHIVEGSIEDFHPTLMKLFRSENTGKLVLQIAAP